MLARSAVQAAEDQETAADEREAVAARHSAQAIQGFRQAVAAGFSNMKKINDFLELKALVQSQPDLQPLLEGLEKAATPVNP